MEKVCQELEKALKTIEQLLKTKKLTKPGAHEELVKAQEDNKVQMLLYMCVYAN